MDRKFFIIANPYAGEGRAQSALMQLKKSLDQKGFYYALFITPKSENLYEFIEENVFTDTTDVVVIGGDGTINATLNAIHGKNMVISFIPVGTGNDFVKTIPIGSNLSQQIDTILNGREKLIDVGECNGRKFINGIGIGFDGEIVYKTQNSKSFFTGHWRFLIQVLKILGNYRSKHFEIEMDGQKLHMKLILMAVHNGTTFGGGFKLNPDAILDDGLLNICTIGRMPALRRFLKLHRLKSATHGKLPEVTFYQTKKLTIYPNDLLLAHIDGECFGSPPFEIQILSRSQKIRIKA
ncbi:hypothetical protein BFP72_18220 [Reichenbachiella sp. 5M10]|uniref:diacylglycerol/lipid kinase family protein n=1 Tax=Reichenbachiella sp. 5M10 TaxID=1889772 RepID=UPI000C1572ED|nr:diacylglycerol kinase family protein [Reichenbachiella sp. 5M10]PIB37204.1 hypothetical protein BFP72_18220 [Reichenbachiella sp. 5M10]